MFYVWGLAGQSARGKLRERMEGVLKTKHKIQSLKEDSGTFTSGKLPMSAKSFATGFTSQAWLTTMDKDEENFVAVWKVFSNNNDLQLWFAFILTIPGSRARNPFGARVDRPG